MVRSVTDMEGVVPVYRGIFVSIGQCSHKFLLVGEPGVRGWAGRDRSLPEGVF